MGLYWLYRDTLLVSSYSRWNSYPRAVKQMLPNNWGLYDMNGNVAEWCWDNYSIIYYEQCAGGVTDPTGSSVYGGNRTVRGGSISSDEKDIKASARSSYSDGDAYDIYIGFRFVRRR